MKIALISKLWERSDPYSTGGTGVLVGNLAEGLVKRGHKVTVFATGDSKTSAKLVSVVPGPYTEKRPYSEILEYWNIANGFARADEFDVINCHVEHKALAFSRTVKTPVIHTFGYGEFFGDEMKLLKEFKKEKFIMVSNALKKKFLFLNTLAVAPIGLDYSRFSFSREAEDYFLFLARMSPQKGPDLAIKAVLKAGVRLVLAGKLSRHDSKYLEEKIFPYIDGDRIIYVGEANFKQKTAFLKKAKALIHPHTYFEAFGISFLEAQACGTPVIAFPNGAAPEVVKNNKTGYLVKDVNGIVKAIKNIDKIDRQACRDHVEKNFSLEKMVDIYEKAFKKVVKKSL